MSSLGETRPDGELVSGGRTWWAHFEFTRIHITPTILPKKIEDLREAGAPSEVSALRKFSPRVARSAVRPSMTAGPEDKSPTSTSRQAKPRPKHR